MIGSIIILFAMFIVLVMIHIITFAFTGWKDGLVIMGFIDLIILGSVLTALGI